MVSKERKNRAKKKEKPMKQWRGEFEDIRRMYEYGGKKRKEEEQEKQ